VDGFLKFWKKTDQGIEFVKQYRSHLGTCFWHIDFCTCFGRHCEYSEREHTNHMLHSLITGLIAGISVSDDGLLLATIAMDKSLKVYDVINFGMRRICCFCFKRLDSWEFVFVQ
jgi:peptidylprolyl isomerase domain and WD repeat-containing protein 1